MDIQIMGLSLLWKLKNAAKSELAEVEQDLDTTDGELEDKQDELEEVEEEKAQTLFEIQERARKTSNNINLAGGMYGAYAVWERRYKTRYKGASLH